MSSSSTASDPGLEYLYDAGPPLFPGDIKRSLGVTVACFAGRPVFEKRGNDASVPSRCGLMQWCPEILEASRVRIGAFLKEPFGRGDAAPVKLRRGATFRLPTSPD